MRKTVCLSVGLMLLSACANRQSNDIVSDDEVALNGEWRLCQYGIGCESTLFAADALYELSFDEKNGSFGLSTDCNRIVGDFVVANDTIRFRNILVTEMACDSMNVEGDMLRLLNDGGVYAVVCAGDSLVLTAPHVGTASFVR